jgi:hypothetical protein
MTEFTTASNLKSKPFYSLFFLLVLFILVTFDLNALTSKHLNYGGPVTSGDSIKKLGGRVFILSIGIDDYSVIHQDFKFKNCSRDAIQLIETIAAQNGFTLPPLAEEKEIGYFSVKDTCFLHAQVLLNDHATRKNVLDALTKVIELGQPNDVFVFNFAGVSLVSPLEKDDYLFITDEVVNNPGLFRKNGQPEVSFHQKACRSIQCSGCKDSTSVLKDLSTCSIGLTVLKDLLELIPCKRQLFVSEAGSSTDFTKSFVKKLIESKPDVATLVDKNRVFILPSLFGLDNFAGVQHGPINAFISMTKNILDVFDQPEKVYQELIVAESSYLLSGSKFPSAGNGFYTTMYSEKANLQNVLDLFPNMGSTSRGVINEPTLEELPKKVSGKHALLIATDYYKTHKQLLNPVRDATQIERILREDYGYQTKILQDSSAESILRNILHYTKTLDSNSQLFVFFAGHGYYDERYFDEGYIVCKESKSPKEDPYLNSYLPFSKLEKMINKVPARQVFVVLDVCFGGTFNEQMSYCQTRTGPSNGGGGLYENTKVDEYISRKLRKTTRRFMTSGGKNEVPDGYGGKSSPFAIKLIEALKTYGGQDGILTTNEIYSVVERIPSDPRMGSFGDDECGSDFFFIPMKIQP